MNVVVINPPLVQLNAPYPSGAYLSSFFKKQGCNVKWYDLSLELYYAIFSRAGLEKLFNLTSEKALKMAGEAEQNGDDATAFNLRRYVSTSQNWINWIDDINAILCGQGREKEHQFLYSPFAPRGNRMETFLANLDRDPTVDDVRFLSSYALADLADYITAVFDPNFSLIRYAESVTAENRSFQEIEAALDSPVMTEFYAPILNCIQSSSSSSLSSSLVEPVETNGVRILSPSSVVSTGSTDDESNDLSQTLLSVVSTSSTDDEGNDLSQTLSSVVSTSSTDDEGNDVGLVLISVPFAGTFVPALYTARVLRKKFPNAKIAMGGGYVNTEMRNWKDVALAKYVDYISYDRGYGSYLELLKNSVTKSPESQIYKLLQFKKNADGTDKIVEPQWQNPQVEKLEAEITRTTFPDYSDINFQRYPRVCDDKNPMHRMWSDGAWIKAYLAHGCYWHRCAFCDTKLDYVCGYKIVDVEALYESLLKTARQKGVYGIHFVDEALPPVAVLRFALCNARHGNPLYFWGNVRFEKAWTKDLAALLSACGFGGVSAGIEVATGQGLKNINKGTDIQSIVSACAAFKEAGILVHAYMIYGFWYDTPQTIIDSMETLRQFYQAGLLDSSFWHQFMLTKYSPKYDELKATFKPEQYQKFGTALDTALDSWMHGQKLEMKVQKWFDFPVPAPTIPKDFVENCIEQYETKSESDVTKSAHLKMYWIASKPVVVANTKNNTTIRWLYLQEELETTLPVPKEKAVKIIETLVKLTPSQEETVHKKAVDDVTQGAQWSMYVREFRNKGLAVLS